MNGQDLDIGLYCDRCGLLIPKGLVRLMLYQPKRCAKVVVNRISIARMDPQGEHVAEWKYPSVYPKKQLVLAGLCLRIQTKNKQ